VPFRLHCHFCGTDLVTPYGVGRNP
jgi:hypothetical protein